MAAVAAMGARPRPLGFTLIETMIAVGILALIGGLIFGVFSRTLDARDRAEAITDQSHQVRQAMLRMAREISMAFLSTHKDCNDRRTQTIFLAKRASNGMRLDFTSFSHFKMRADANESDQNELSYFVDVDPDDHAHHHLMRREQNRIDDKPTEGGVVQRLAEDVAAVDFSFYDPRSDRWEDEWDSSSRDTFERLPKYVRIQMTVRDARAHDQIYVTKARLFLKEAINIPGLNAPPCIE